MIKLDLGYYGDVSAQDGYGNVEYITPSRMSKEVFDELIATWFKYYDGVKHIKDEIFNSEEEAWKGMWADEPDHQAFIKGLELSLRLLEAKDEHTQ